MIAFPLRSESSSEAWQPSKHVLHKLKETPISQWKQRIPPVKKDHVTKRQFAGYAKAELELESANRARITASLKEQRLKRDAEIAALGPPAKPEKATARRKAP